MLVIDPSVSNREALRRMLDRHRGCREARTGTEGLSAVSEARVDCALVSDATRDLDLLELIGELRRDGVGVVVVVEELDALAAFGYLRAGAQDCVARVGLLPSTLDAAVRRAVERARRDRETALQHRVWERMPLGVLVLESAEGIGEPRVVYENPAGRAVRELLRDDDGVIPGVDRRGLREVCGRVILSGEPARIDPVEVGRDGGAVQIYGARISRLDGRSVLVLLEDMTELLMTRRQLEAASHMEAIGRLAGGVAHDFNNMLTVISGHAGFIRDATPVGDPCREDADAIIDAASRSAELTRQLLAFSRRQIRAPRVLELNAQVESVEPLLRRIIGEDIRLLTDLDGGTGSIEADPTQVEQVLMNLAVNARDAMPRGGVLRVETRARVVGEGFSASGLAVAPGPYSELCVIDVGIGMGPETLAKMFEPFFSTKSSDEGTGLGLATVYGIVSQSGGCVWADSQLGHGTTFHVLFPKIDRRPTMVPEAGRRESLAGGETILFVEDERLVRRAIRRILETAGYRVLDAELPSLALEVARAHAGMIDLVLTDIVMPEMSGRELARTLAAELPGSHVLFMSGYTNDSSAGKGSDVLKPGTPFVGKPFTRQVLLESVHEALSRGPTLEELVDADGP